MKKNLLLSLLILLIVQNLYPQNPGGRKVIGYYNWDNSGYPASAIDFTSLTHICHAFIWPLADGSIDQSQIALYPDLVTAAHNKGVKVLVSVGGFGTSTQNAGFKSMVNTTASRSAFITNLVNFIKANNYDGADFDWEYPASTDKANYTALLTDLRAAFNANNIPLLTAAVYNSPTAGYDVPKLNTVLDWIGIMTYDFTGNWEAAGTKLLHNSALYSSSQQTYSVDKSVNAWAAAGMPASKICAGMPFYGYLMNAPDMFGAITTTTGAKAVSYSTIASSYLNNSGWEYNFDNTTKNPYLRNTAHTQVLTFDDTASARMKCDYINSKGLAGAIIWKIAQSYNSTTKINPLLKTAGDFLIRKYVTPSVAVTSPNGGEVWMAGSYYNVTWTSSGIYNVRIEYSKDNGTSWSVITSSIAADAGSCSWSVPNTPSLQCRIRISDADNPGYNDLCNSVFEIRTPVPLAPVLKLPDNYAAGQPVDLTLSWNNSAFAEGYRLQIAKDQNFTSLVTDTSLTLTSFKLSGLGDGLKYFWRLSSKNNAGTSAYSEVRSFTTLLNAPEKMAAQAVDYKTIKLSWSDRSANESGFIVERKLSSETAYKVIDSVKANILTYTDSTLSNGASCSYRIRAYSQFALSAYAAEVSVSLTAVAENLNGNTLPEDYVLYQNYPNPFNPSTKIRYSIPAESRVRIVIYNAIGAFVAELVNEVQPAGYREISFNAGDLSSGTYFCSMTAGAVDGSRQITTIRKAILVK